MVFYALGSLLFLFALLGALAVIAGNLLHYRAQMVAALGALSLDRVGSTPAAPKRVVRTRPAGAAA